MINRREGGAALILAFGILLVVVLLASAAIVFIDFQAGFADNLIKNTQNYYLAEAGYVRAIKEVFDARVNNRPVPSQVVFTESIGGIQRRITVSIGVSGANPSQYTFESKVE